MRRVYPVILVLFLAAFIITPQAHAIIFLPALLLIPIAKIVAIVIGGLSLPALGVGALWSNLFGKSLKRTITVVVIILVVLAATLLIILKLHNPDRPFI